MITHSSIAPLTVAQLAYQRAKELHSFAHYTGILTLNGLARLALCAESAELRAQLLEEAQLQYRPFLSGEAEISFCNFDCYRCGGSGAAYLWWKDALPNADASTFEPFINQLLNEAPRDKNGALCHPEDAASERIWIDIAFAVTPFLLYCGLKLERDDLISQAWKETRLLIEALYVPETGLVNQAINFRGPGHRTDDHWSRGNGWAIHGLAALIESMPKQHPDRPTVEKMYVKFVDACLKYQNPNNGLWHQEMTNPESYIETSGSGLLLHGIGIGLADGILNASYQESFDRGLKGYLSYIALNGSVHNTCTGCLCPNQGTKEDYIQRTHKTDDCHAHGPVIFAYAQAYANGIKTIKL
ncbi:glycoside hydrolase family 88 protein [Coraliomargarita sp. SDUM461004]|uniref:Glycoside hydrolase family 88 protein n=1 Tax=Thalassobacterium sedimentorum TaxID=3041258 RepID=A0ABU1AM35_9BACT|nr:glycoside hydrolase family 88 protein [Coraliomargarita sp. SDUM461004]MDQ8194663.1 glycoside hydrolase family 88 protein [Coraliomargarita sp. SDUM461004]